MSSSETGSAFTPVASLMFTGGINKERDAYKWPSFSSPALWHIWNSYPSSYGHNHSCIAEQAVKSAPNSPLWSVCHPYTNPEYPNALLPHSGYSHFLGFSPCPEDEKPTQSYIGLIGQAILSSPEKKLILSEIYNYIQTQYPYFRKRGTGWRNSIRHNLSLNDCFVKTGRSPNGKGHFWAISPLYYDDFARGVIRRRTSRRAAKSSRKVSQDIKEIIPVPREDGKLTTMNTGDDPTPSPTCQDSNKDSPKQEPLNVKVEEQSTEKVTEVDKPKGYDVESLLAPDRASRDSAWNYSVYPVSHQTPPIDGPYDAVSNSRDFLATPYCYPYSAMYNSRFLY